jgi:phosphoenolpyruvate carboxykinase (GTP)
MLAHDTVFTNCALTDGGDIWWEGMTDEPPPHLVDWRGNDWTPESESTAAHPNARFTVAIDQCPSAGEGWDDPAGVPIDAIMFGGRRAHVVPLVFEARNWEHGVFLGSTMASEKTAAAAGNVGELRFDPMAMLPFCGYNMADYFAHWLKIGREADASKLPKIFHVNWFRKDPSGRFLWPGYGENSRVLAWVFARCAGHGAALQTPIGRIPPVGEEGIDTRGLDISETDIAELLRVDVEEWRRQLPHFREHLGKFERLPRELHEQLQALERRLFS